MRMTGEHQPASEAGLIACPRCDVLHLARPGRPLRCTRCGKRLADAPRRGAFPVLIALSLASVVLMALAVFLPFIEISRWWFGNATSLIGVAMAFAQGWMIPLAVAVLLMVVALPVLRAMLLIHVLAPLAVGRPAWPGAAAGFRLWQALTPWCMAEIFAVGIAVALPTLAGQAQVSLGPAVWAFGGLILVSIATRRVISPPAIWDAIEGGAARSAPVAAARNA